MFVTVAICTWNRSALLRQALEQMTKLVIPPGLEWELLVVNNNSTDATDKVIASYAPRLPVRRLFQATPGKSRALNLAVREARGEYILLTDDDALVDENWMAAYVRAIKQWPGAAFFGGPVRPAFAALPPTWLRQAWPLIAGAYAERDLGTQAVPFRGGDHIPYGVNWAVRLKEHRAYLYDPSLGRQPGKRIGGEDDALVGALLADGYEGWWVPEAIVQHYVPVERMKTRYIRSYYMGHGEFVHHKSPPWDGPVLFGRPRWLWKHAVLAEAKYRARRLVSPPEVWIRDLITASRAWGQLLA